MRSYANGGSNVTWASAQARSAEVKGYPPFSIRNQGFFGRHFRRISQSLPHMPYNENDGYGRNKWRVNTNTKYGRLLAMLWRNIWRLRRQIIVVLAIILSVVFFYVTRE